MMTEFNILSDSPTFYHLIWRTASSTWHFTKFVMIDISVIRLILKTLDFYVMQERLIFYNVDSADTTFGRKVKFV